ncbi:MAG: DsbA family protein, partial [Chloroflexi bacterium]|nr:DsbA family protein [Chloroflexota bacterium]
MWLDRVKQVYGDDMEITWRNFSLEQNAFTLKQKSEGTESDWKVWEQEDPTQGRSLMGQIAAEAARRQGPELYDKFHLALLTARHGGDGRIALNEEEPLVDLAQQVGLDTAKIREDLRDPALRKSIGADHEDAVSQSIFGTPTFVFENGNAAFIKAFIPPQ